MNDEENAEFSRLFDILMRTEAQLKEANELIKGCWGCWEEDIGGYHPVDLYKRKYFEPGLEPAKEEKE